MDKPIRYYQQEADNCITEELLNNGKNKCLVKMFCGTGKSRIMRELTIIKDKHLVVYVFPSLSLLDQFYHDYFTSSIQQNILKICSEIESTTNKNSVIEFLICKEIHNKYICITYQSYDILLDCLEEIDCKIDVCVYDEAHHVVGEKAQDSIFKKDGYCLKQIFFTATPKNSNGIIMYDRHNEENNMCGKLVYDYSYLRGVNEEYLNPFEIRIDMYTENNNKSIYESIIRSILVSGNSRVLTFHSKVDTGRDTDVTNFVNESIIKSIFDDICKKEFPEKKGIYKKIIMVEFSSKLDGKCKDCLNKCKNHNYKITNKKCCRFNLLKKFDSTPDNEIFIISSCETIGEGVDTKNANMCVFVDPKHLIPRLFKILAVL